MQLRSGGLIEWWALPKPNPLPRELQPLSPHSTAPRYRSYWLLMVSSAVAAWETLAEETFAFLEGPERRCWIYSPS